ncbi:hypothetical protein C9374_005477 [Naegleria lovaniensis]|uniref:RWP-RK domain-containing protein n=1 Tax=Naegleria lovaniensis TaxID=51637 RepID=A0AA88GQL0_NAELO|nr:uncharacterized protein C9374_005477 [Naegleria lovaniensis]KAG2382275.1 hypothetical protein C9374_005477 [Naegleria lovaniensis]
MKKNSSAKAVAQQRNTLCSSNQASSMLLPVFPSSTIIQNKKKENAMMNDIQKLLQPALSQDKAISPTPSTVLPSSPIISSNNPSSPSTTNSSPAAVNKNMWFSPHVFLKSFPVFPPPTRNLTHLSSEQPQQPQTLPIFPKKEEQPEKKSPYISSSEHERRSVCSSSSNNSIQKKRKTKRNKIDIPLNELIRFMTLPQSVAAKKLNVSLSTLKRRYYELVSEFEGSKDTKAKWPSMPTNYHELSSTSEEAIPTEQKGSLQYILNRYDAHDNTFVDSLSMTVLNFSFKQNLTQSSNDE